MTQPKTILPSRLAEMLAEGRAVLIDVRDPDEFARAHIKGARSEPLATLIGTTLTPEAGKTVVFTCRSGMRTGANCDRLQQCVRGDAHVLEGGIDAWTGAGFPVEINAKPHEHWVQLKIRDHGKGVPEENLRKLTRPFFRGDAARTSATGAGLGLAIVEKAIARMGGTFSLANSDTGGLAAHIKLQRA